VRFPGKPTENHEETNKKLQEKRRFLPIQVDKHPEVSCKYSLSRGFSISLSCRTQKLLSKILDWTVDDDPLKRFH
jgi:hypothetical protein